MVNFEHVFANEIDKEGAIKMHGKILRVEVSDSLVTFLSTTGHQIPKQNIFVWFILLLSKGGYKIWMSRIYTHSAEITAIWLKAFLEDL